MEDREQFVSKVINLAKKGTNVTVLGLHGIGKGDLIRRLLKQCDSDCCSTCILLDPNELISKTEVDFYRYFLSTLIENIEESFSDIEMLDEIAEEGKESLLQTDQFILFNTTKKVIKFLINNTETSLSLLLKDLTLLKHMPETFYTSLRALRNIDRERIAFIFIDNVNYLTTFSSGNQAARELLTNLLLWMPMPNKDEFNEIVNTCEDKFEYKLTPEQKEIIFNETAGHAGLTKYFIHYFSENPEIPPSYKKVLKTPSIKTRMTSIVEDLTNEDLSLLLDLANDEKIDEKSRNKTLTRLKNAGIIEQQGSKYLVRVGLLRRHLKINNLKPNKKKETEDKPKPKNSNIQIKDGVVLVESNPIEEVLSQRELDILSFFLRNANKVISREEIAEIIWGSDSIEEYSEWAIDQAISRLRKKINDNAYSPKYLKTLKGRGFLFTN